MVKKLPLLILMLAVCVPSTSFADGYLDNLVFGASLIRQEATFTVDISGNKTEFRDKATGVEIYVDKYLKGKYRAKAMLGRIAYDGFDITELMLSGDYLIPVNPQISLFVGGAAGAGIQQFSGGSLGDASTGMIIGGQLGGIYYINKNFMAEMGFRIRSTSIETEINDQQSTSEVTQLDETYLSLLVMF